MKAGSSAVFLCTTLCLWTLPACRAAVIEAPPNEPAYRQPQIAISGSRAGITFGAGNSIYFAGSTDGGRTFGAPVLVNSAGILSLGMHRGPRIVMTPAAIVISAVYGDKGKGADGDLLAFRSTDGGRTWSKALRVNDKPAAAREGLHAMASDGEFLYAVWLDDRNGGKELYGAESKDGGATWSPNRLIYHSPAGHICECCHPSVVVRDGGREIYAMFRNWLDGSRDFYLAVSKDGGATFSASKLGEGTWKLNACPMDGGALNVDAKGPVTVWRREMAVFTSRPGEAETQVGAGKNPSMAGGVVLWSATDGLRSARPGSPAELLDADGTYPSLASDGRRTLAAWESKNRIMVREVR